MLYGDDDYDEEDYEIAIKVSDDEEAPFEMIRSD